jgi:FixJ family two-component response regulator
MTSRNEHKYAELLFNKELLESFSNEASAHYEAGSEQEKKDSYRRFIRKLRWHINNTLAGRQKEVIIHIVQGRTEREIAEILGITHQVVHIYKTRAVNKLKEKIKPQSVWQKTNR